MLWKAALLCGVALLPAIGTEPARAEDVPNCYGISVDDDLSGVSSAAVIAKKVHFLSSDGEKRGCPAAGKMCRRPAYVHANDRVVLDGDLVIDDYVCAVFVDPHGNETDGWLPQRAVKSDAPTPTWPGTWKRDTSAEIDVKAIANGKLEVSGDASWGSGAATHEGSIYGVIDATETEQGFATDGDKQIAYDTAGEYDCAVKLRQLGSYLVVADNGNCGGANVSFTGVYLKR